MILVKATAITGLSTAASKTISLKPVAATNAVDWICGLTTDGTDIDPKYVPSSCRGTKT